MHVKRDFLLEESTCYQQACITSISIYSAYCQCKPWALLLAWGLRSMGMQLAINMLKLLSVHTKVPKFKFKYACWQVCCNVLQSDAGHYYTKVQGKH
jgi:hypothetical protein